MTEAERYIGASIGPWRIERIVGSGGFGTCFLGVNGSRRAALKLIDGSRILRDEAATLEEAAWHEAAALQLCEGVPSVPVLLGVERLRTGELFLVESLMPGNSLAHLVFKARQRFSLTEIGAVGLKLIDILAAVHARGVIHSDVRIANVLVESADVALVDFGMPLFFERMHAAEAFQTDCVLDRAGLAEVLIFLLYSDRSRVTRRLGMRSRWFHELALTEDQKQFLFDLFDDTCRFTGWEDVRSRFSAAFLQMHRTAWPTRMLSAKSLVNFENPIRDDDPAASTAAAILHRSFLLEHDGAVSSSAPHFPMRPSLPMVESIPNAHLYPHYPNG